jgi:hypothetical protein
MPIEAAVAVGPGLAHMVLVPSKYSSGHPVTDAGDLVDHTEYKQRQYPPGPKITPRNFGHDRRPPITNRWQEPHTG